MGGPSAALQRRKYECVTSQHHIPTDSYTAVSYKEVVQYNVKMKTLSGGHVCPSAVYQRQNRRAHSPNMYIGEDSKLLVSYTA